MLRKFVLLLSFGFIVGLLFIGSMMQVDAAPNTTLSVDVPVIGEGDDFSTQVLGVPWDMGVSPYPDFSTVFKDVDRTTFNATGDMWDFQATSNDPAIWLLWPGIENTQTVLKLGDRYPIDTAKYTLLSVRLCSPVNNDFAMVYWFFGRFVPRGLPQNEVSELIPIQQGCHVYTINMDQQGGWNGDVMGFRFDPVSLTSGVHLQLDWARLTTENLSNNVPITWAGLDMSANRLNFYLNNSCNAQDSTLIGWVDNPGRQGTFNWGSQLQSIENSNYPWMYLPLPESIEPGQYSIFMIPEGSDNPICSDTALEIRKAPIAVIQKPSYFSGPDYATEVVGDPWGFSNVDDFSRLDGFSQVSYQEGLFSGVTVNSDPKMFPRVDAPIDAGKYKYATFRVQVEGTQDVANGWVQRFFWWQQGPTIDPVTTEDMVLYEGWQMYTIDLSNALIQSGGSSWKGYPIALRFDPEEISVANKLYFDYLTLTGDEIISPGEAFPIYYELASDHSADVVFYYDVDRNPSNGRTLIGTVLPQSSTPSNTSAVANFMVYLPLMVSATSEPVNDEVDLLTGDVYTWNTSGVPVGTYYVSVEVDDGYNVTTWYSEVPVYIQANQ